ncbi:MAG: DUF4168 domain-containing protein [Leptolyngbyaceae cyanobacterium]
MLSLLLNFLQAVILQPLKALVVLKCLDSGPERFGTVHRKLRVNQKRSWQDYAVRLSQGALVVALAWLLTTQSAWAEDEAVTSVEANPTPTQLNAADIPSDQVNQFVDAYLQVVALIDERSEELKRATTESESLQIQQSIQAEAYELLETAGLTRQTYWQMIGLANSDTEFRDRILAQLEEKG